MNLEHISDTLRAISSRGCGLGLAVVGTLVVVVVAPQSVGAAASGVATITVVVIPGSLSAGAVNSAPALLQDSGGVASSATHWASSATRIQPAQVRGGTPRWHSNDW